MSPRTPHTRKTCLTPNHSTLCYVPERFPENWYRRSTPYGITPFLEGLLPTYLSGPALATNPLSALLNKQQINELGCAIAQGLESGIPVSLLGSTYEKIQASVQYLQSKIASGFPVSPVGEADMGRF